MLTKTEMIRKLFIGMILYLLVPASILLQVYFFLPARARFSWRWLVILFAATLVVELAVWLQKKYFLLPAWRGLNRRAKAGWLLAAGLAAALLVAYVAPNPAQVMSKFPSLAPVETLELRPVFNNPGATLELWKIKTGDDRIPNENIVLEGNWQEDTNRLWTSDPEARLVVSANVAEFMSISFWRSATSGQALVHWNGKEKLVRLQAGRTAEIIVRFPFDRSTHHIPPAAPWLRLLTLPGWAYLAWMVGAILFYGGQELNGPAR